MDLSDRLDVRMQIESVFAQFGIAIILATASSVGSAQDRNWASFPELIKMPGGIQAALEHCDGHPDFEAALANWLEAAKPESAAERRVVREASLQLLEDTADRQVALALIDGLLRHALEDVNRDETIVPERL